jgi:alkylation response protein AidB-like acyl-CoA dehydrogenase
MTDASALVAERIDKLLAELDPASTDPVEFRGRQYDLGLAWVHFPEGSGGLGVPPALQRQVDERVFAAGAAPPASR